MVRGFDVRLQRYSNTNANAGSLWVARQSVAWGSARTLGDVDGGVGLGVSSRDRAPFFDLETAQTPHLDRLPLAQGLGHAVKKAFHHGEHISLGNAVEFLGQRIDQILSNHFSTCQEHTRIRNEKPRC